MKWLHWVKREFLKVFPAFVFFLIAFSLINMIEGLFINSEGIFAFSIYEVIIAAALVAKILIVINHLPFVNAFPNKPLICNVLWKTFLYEFFTFFVRLSIRVIPPIVTTYSLSQGYANFLASFNFRSFLAVQLCYLLLFFTFVSAEETILAIGPQKMRKLFLGK